MLDTWLIAIAARLLRKRVLFWTHGWVRREGRIKGLLRNLYFGIAERVLTYGERARTIASETGFRIGKIVPIYNSLDWDKAQSVVARMEQEDAARDKGGNALEPSIPTLICTARLTKLCRFDLLLNAMNLLSERGIRTQLVLVGEGPERARLEEQAKRLNLNVMFVGALYDEERLGALIYAADMAVSPGKVGLTAVHSLMYGTPVITHGNLDNQMPEVEAIVPGSTGLFFEEGNVEDLAEKIAAWLASKHDRSAVRSRCHHVIEAKYNPATQRRLIEDALDEVFAASEKRIAS
ncbi:glycosyltransferase family 4 protein [Bradyrhizobium neotropicale]|uniref:glycosyltransferase family 4 protein n=1 Tax=Bradyrhizobium neotropicale TaxID=1497615 RepID=UPI001AD77F38|nr:glycosyltransferase family 4 protein [Bradyrhizobium neotropicale]MBO4227990.1 glycosyltransferase [Bradyrhizobium neotropicale]